MKYICLKSMNSDHKHYSNCSEEESKMNVRDILKYSEDVQYEILGFANTNEEAQKILYTNEEEFTIILMNYLRDTNNKLLEEQFSSGPDLEIHDKQYFDNIDN